MITNTWQLNDPPYLVKLMYLVIEDAERKTGCLDLTAESCNKTFKDGFFLIGVSNVVTFLLLLPSTHREVLLFHWFQI